MGICTHQKWVLAPIQFPSSFTHNPPVRYSNSKDQIMRLLIVEDNPEMRRLIKSLVADLAEAVCECGDGDEALAAFVEHRPDWVLMDIKMARLDGLAASRQIKTAYPQANICIVTDYGDSRTRETARQAGVAAYVLKESLYEIRSIIAAGAKVQ
jgi:two-component system, NarL family, response regulator